MDGWTGLLNWKRGPMTKKKKRGPVVAIRPTSYFSHLFATWTLFIESQSYRVAKKDTARIAVSDGPKLVQTAKAFCQFTETYEPLLQVFPFLVHRKSGITRNALRGQNGKTAILIEILAAIRCIDMKSAMDGDDI
jgi:hypothetical protein